MNRLTIAAAGVLAAVAAGPVAATEAAPAYRTFAHKSGLRHEATRAELEHPSAIEVILTGGSGDTVYACDRGNRVPRPQRRAFSTGVHRLSGVRGSSNCTITSFVNGRNRVSVTIRARGATRSKQHYPTSTAAGRA